MHVGCVVSFIFCYPQSQDSSGNKPTKLVSMVTAVKRNHDSGAEAYHPQPPQQQPPRPTSDGVIYGNFNERRIEYEEVLLSERTDSQYSQSESYLSERCVWCGRECVVCEVGLCVCVCVWCRCVECACVHSLRATCTSIFSSSCYNY